MFILQKYSEPFLCVYPFHWGLRDKIQSLQGSLVWQRNKTLFWKLEIRELSTLNTIYLALSTCLCTLSNFYPVLQGRDFCLHFVMRKMRVREVKQLAQRLTFSKVRNRFLHLKLSFSVRYHTVSKSRTHLPWHVHSVSWWVNVVPLEQWFSTLPVHWNHLESFKISADAWIPFARSLI